MTNDSFKAKANAAIEAIMSNTSVSPEQTVSDLEEIAEEIEAKLAALRED